MSVCNVCTWNVNGIRAVGGRRTPKESLPEVLESLGSDIICLQETKTDRAGLDESNGRPRGFHAFFAFSRKRKALSYSGVVTFVKKGGHTHPVRAATVSLDGKFYPDSISDAFPGISPNRALQLDAEGRVVVTDHEGFVLFNVYAPCCSSEDEENQKALERLKFKAEFQDILFYRLKQQLEIGRRVIVAGDLNTVVSPLDCAWDVPEENLTRSRWIRTVLESGFRDAFREKNRNERVYTCWNTKTGARENNYGSRIDYILVDEGLAEGIMSCTVHPNVVGSDHCPVTASLKIPSSSSPQLPQEEEDGEERKEKDTCHQKCPASCSCHFPELAGSQSKIKNFLSMSAGGMSDDAIPATFSSNMERFAPPARDSDCRLKRKRLRQAKLPFASSPSWQPLLKLPNPNPEDEARGDNNGRGQALPGAQQATAKKEWEALFSEKKRSAVCCRGHNEPAVLRTVKSGDNIGRTFWCCKKPGGKSGDTNARCDFFKWASAGPKGGKKS